MFRGKTILALVGSPIERVDPFRFYTNRSMPKARSLEVVNALKQQGAEVTIIEAGSESARAFLSRAAALSGPFDIVLQLASISSIAPAKTSGSKIQKTGPDSHQLFEVIGNINVQTALEEVFPASDVMGVNQHQQWFFGGDESICAAVQQLFHSCDERAVNEAENASHPTQAIAQITEPNGRHVVITAGRTEETLVTSGDSLTNGFTGKQAMEIASAFANCGMQVTLICGKIEVDIPRHPNIQTLHVATAQEMFEAGENLLERMPIDRPIDIFIGVAAVADFSIKRPANIILKEGEKHRLDLQETKSIIANAASHKNRPKIVVSFAAQSPETIEHYALQKYEALGVDLTVANPIGVDIHEAMLINHQGLRRLGDVSKAEIAANVVAEVLDML